MSAPMAGVSPWIQALGWTLLHFIWQGIVVGVAFAAVRALLPRHRCNARYAAGLVALGVLAAWPVLTFVSLLADATGAAMASGVGALVDASPGRVMIEAGLPAVVEGSLPWLVAAWVVGVLLMAARALHDWRALTDIARRWAEPSAALDSMLQTLSARFGFLRSVRVLVTARVDTPMLIGWLRPIVLLPAAVALRFPREQLELILAHELGHLRRYDHLVNLAQALVETLLFYHPVVHWVSRDVRNERELCCDELVLRVTAGQRRDYARTLASLEELRQGAPRLALAASGGQLVERVRRIAGLPADRSSVGADGPGRWVLVVAALCLAVFAAQRVDPTDDAVVRLADVPVAWLVRPDLRALPLAAIALPFHRPQLRAALPVAKPVRPSGGGHPSEAPGALSTPDPVTNTQGATAWVPPPSHPLPAASEAAPMMRTATAAAVVPFKDQGGHQATSTPAAVIPVLAVARPSELAGAALAATVKPEPARVHPVAIRSVVPDFPVTARTSAGHVDASFTIAADGTLGDIRIADGAGYAFAEAARRALRQWRFDPARLPPDRSARYAQSFVFEGGAKRKFDHDDCLQSTGSMICRPLEESANPVTTIYARADSAQASN